MKTKIITANSNRELEEKVNAWLLENKDGESSYFSNAGIYGRFSWVGIFYPLLGTHMLLSSYFGQKIGMGVI